MDLVVGRVVKSHGVRGELVVEVRTDSPDERFSTGSRLRGRIGRGESARDRDVTVEAARNHSGRLLVRLEGVADREAADALRGMLLMVDSEAISDPEDPEEFHDHQLMGLRVVDLLGTQIGDVVDIVHTAAGELLSLTLTGGGTALIPFVRSMVPSIDLLAGTVTIDPPEGLLELGTT